MVRTWFFLFASVVQTVFASSVTASDPASLEFFEAKIRPVLIEHCYECHNSTGTSEGKLRLDLRQGLVDGGESGPAIVASDPSKSLLLKAIAHENPDFKMPPTGVKLSDEVIDDFRRWIAAGATDPREKAPTAEQMAESKSWEKTLESRKKWWSFQPILAPQLPSQPTKANTSEFDRRIHPIDQFIGAKLDAANLPVAPRATNQQLIRRVYFNLIGLPPSREEYSKWNARFANAQSSDAQQQVLRKLVDELLGDVRFGERWARHWMDWIRYAESHGSEGDPAIANAWMYRDYLIRSLNADIPLDQMIREHIAGDLIPARVDSKLHLNESLIATSHWRMVFHGFSPTDALDERVRFIDDQINSFSKAFLGVTVSCARCHDHKFDPISQADYYAMFGVLSSCRPGRSSAESSEYLHQHRDALIALKGQLRTALVEAWKSKIPELETRLAQAAEKTFAKPEDQRSSSEKAFWHSLRQLRQPQSNAESNKSTSADPSFQWNLSQATDAAKWFRVGIGLENENLQGDIIVATQGEAAIQSLHFGGLTSRSLSDKDPARLSSPDFECPKESVLWVQAEGDGGASLRYVVQNYPRNGTIYPTQSLRPGLQWYKFDIAYWDGDLLHIEVTTPRDAPLLTGDQPRSWFRVMQAVVLPRDQSPNEGQSAIAQLMRSDKSGNLSVTKPASGVEVQSEKQSEAELVKSYATIISQAIEDWATGNVSASQAEVLDQCVQLGILPNQLSENSTIEKIVSEYREVENQLPVSTRVPCLEETQGFDAALYVRGDHRRPDKNVKRRFLEAIDATPFDTKLSGRLELADRVLSNDNPLTRRVFANRIWHHLFGAGIVPTPDNFGRLGALPTHPELLDSLALRLPELNWSLKALIRDVVMTEAWQRSSTPSPESMERDSDNQLLSHANIRRYEAEAVRDALLVVAGNLDASNYGPPQAFSGVRRSIYLPVVRNSLHPFLRTFDFPEPFSSVGRRDQTNVPAQSLTLMNDAFVTRQAIEWSQSVFRKSKGDKAELISEMIESAFTRPATPSEINVLSSIYDTSITRINSSFNDAMILASELEQAEAEVRSLEAKIRQAILAKRNSRNPKGQDAKLTPSNDPALAPLTPLVEWRFDDWTNNQIGNAAIRLKLSGMSTIENGALRVKPGSYAVSEPLTKPLREKTLAVLVQLENLKQRGGGAIAVQTVDGSIFDSIVFGEQAPQQWLAGSNSFSRSKSFVGPPEEEASSTPVHFAIAYERDGTIRGYRNGKLYGQAYQSKGVQEFAANQTVVTLGLRHIPNDHPTKSLSGEIYHAQVFDRALSAEEIQKIASDVKYVSSKELVESMTEKQLKDWKQLKIRILEARKQLKAVASSLPKSTDEESNMIRNINMQSLALSQVARTIFTLKEFIYVP